MEENGVLGVGGEKVSMLVIQYVLKNRIFNLIHLNQAKSPF